MSGIILLLLVLLLVFTRQSNQRPLVSCKPEVLVDLPRRVRAVERVEMDSSNLVVEQVAALFGGPVDADLGDGLGIVVASTDRAEKPGRETCSQGQLGHPRQVFLRGDRHDPGDDRHPDAGQLAPLTEIVKVGVAEKELGADVVGAGVHLALEIVELVQAVGGRGMAFREPRDPDAEPLESSTGVCDLMKRTSCSAYWNASRERS